MAFLAGLVPHIPAIATGVGAAIGGIGEIFRQRPAPAIRAAPALRAGQPLGAGPAVSGRTLAQQRATPMGVAPRTLTPIEQLIRGGPAPAQAVGGIAQSRSQARVGQQYYTSGGHIRTKRRAKKTRKKVVRRRRRMTKKDKLQYAMGALAGGAKVGEILALMQAV